MCLYNEDKFLLKCFVHVNYITKIIFKTLKFNSIVKSGMQQSYIF